MANPTSDTSCFGWLGRNLCQDWSQPIEGVGCLGATGVSILGCATGNGPLAGMGAIAAATNCLAMSRMVCLGDTIRLNQSTEQLHKEVQKLLIANKDLQNTKDQQQKILDQLSRHQEELLKQSKELQAEKQETLNQLAEVTKKLTQMQDQYESIPAEYRKIQKESAADHAVMAATSVSISGENSRLIDSQSQLTGQITNLSAAAKEASEQNTQMKKQIDELGKQCQKLQSEKAALEHLLAAERDAYATLQAQIQQNKADQSALQALFDQMKYTIARQSSM